MKTFTAFAGTGLLLLGSAAYAQDVQDPADSASPAASDTEPMEATPAPDAAGEVAMPADTAGAEIAPEADASAHGAHEAHAAGFSDAEIESFAAAAIEIQDLQGDATLDATAKQEQSATIVAEAGLDAETFNAIGQAMQNDPEIAERVQMAAAGLQGQPQS